MLKKTKIRLGDIEMDIKLLRSKLLTGIEQRDKLNSDTHRNSETLTRLAEIIERTLNKLNALAEHFNLQITYPGGLAKVDEIPVECYPCTECGRMFTFLYWSKLFQLTATTVTSPMASKQESRLCIDCQEQLKTKGGASK